MISETRFNRVMNDLSLYGTEGHERLVFQKGVLKTKNCGSWFDRLIQYFYKPKNERIQNVAQFAQNFFEESEAYIQDTTVLQRFVPVLHRGKCGSRLEDLIARINEKKTEHQDSTKDSDSTVDSTEISSVIIEPTESSDSIQETTSLLETNTDYSLQEIEQHNLYKTLLRSYVIKEALGIARGIEADSFRVRALSRVAVGQAKVDQDGARELLRVAYETARGFRHLVFRDVELKICISEQVKINLPAALEAVKEIEDKHSFDFALKAIVAEQAKDDLEVALETAGEIEGAEPRAEAFAIIAEEQGKIDSLKAREIFDKAVETASGIRFLVTQERVLRDIAAGLAKLDLEVAFEIARGLEDSSFRASALGAVASEQAKINLVAAQERFAEALELARTIEAPINRTWVIRDIAAGQAKVDLPSARETFEEAIQSAREIDSDFSRSHALEQIVVKQVKTDLEEALELARGIEEVIFRSAALYKVVAEMAKEDLEGALLLSQEIENDLSHVKALVAIAEQM